MLPQSTNTIRDTSLRAHFLAFLRRSKLAGHVEFVGPAVQLWSRSVEPPPLGSADSAQLVIPAPHQSVGDGHYSDLFLGVYRPSNLVLAMKRPKFSLHGVEAREEAERHFKREARTWQLLNNRNILPFYGLVEIDAEVYLVSPWIAYGDLWRFVTARLKYLELENDKRQNHPSHAIHARYREFDVIVGIASGLAYLHSNRIVHGDLKALNVLLDGELNALLCDFGMTTHLDGKYTESTLSYLNRGGTSQWLAPELMVEKPQKSFESDLYAFGMTVTEILTGEKPFPHLNPVSLPDQVKDGTRPKPEPRQREGQDFDELWKVAVVCWDADPTKRSSADAVVTTLTGVRTERSPQVAQSPSKLDNAGISLDWASRDIDNRDNHAQPTNARGSLGIGTVSKSPAVNALANYLASGGPARQLWNPSLPPLRLSAEDSSHVIIHEPSRSVACGNFCDIFFGAHLPSNLVLAVKRPKYAAHGRAAAAKAKRNFIREEKAWSSLQHPNILQFCGHVEIEGEMYLVSPWIAYSDLWGVIIARLEYLELSIGERHKYPSHTVYTGYREFDIVLGTASGLAYLHSKNIIHGGIKASNVLLDKNLNPLLCDFGVTRLLDWDYIASSSAFLNESGSWRWMAPELMTEIGTRRTRESDMYAFGMTISEILTGQPPFPGLNMFQIAGQVLSGGRPPAEPSEREGQDFDVLWKVATACWDQDPAKRPSADEVVRTLANSRSK